MKEIVRQKSGKVFLSRHGGAVYFTKIVLHKFSCTALSVELLDNARKSTLYAPFFL